LSAFFKDGAFFLSDGECGFSCREFVPGLVKPKGRGSGRLQKMFQVACAVDDAEDENFIFVESIEEEMLGKSRNRRSSHSP